MPFKEFKFQVVSVVLELDDDGEIIGERQTAPEMLYGRKGVRAWLKNFPRQLDKLEREATSDS